MHSGARKKWVKKDSDHNNDARLPRYCHYYPGPSLYRPHGWCIVNSHRHRRVVSQNTYDHVHLSSLFWGPDRPGLQRLATHSPHLAKINRPTVGRNGFGLTDGCVHGRRRRTVAGRWWRQRSISQPGPLISVGTFFSFRPSFTPLIVSFVRGVCASRTVCIRPRETGIIRLFCSVVRPFVCLVFCSRHEFMHVRGVRSLSADNKDRF